MKKFFSNAFRGAHVAAGIFLSFIIATVLLHAAQVTFSSGDVISADDMNSNFTELYNKVSSLESQVSTMESTLSDVSDKASTNETNLAEIRTTTRVTDDTGKFLGYCYGRRFKGLNMVSPKGYAYTIGRNHKMLHSSGGYTAYFTGEDGLGDVYHDGKMNEKDTSLVYRDGVLEIYKPKNIGSDGFAVDVEPTADVDGDGFYICHSKGDHEGIQNGTYVIGNSNYYHVEMELTTHEETGIPETITPPLHFGDQ